MRGGVPRNGVPGKGVPENEVNPHDRRASSPAGGDGWQQVMRPAVRWGDDSRERWGVPAATQPTCAVCLVVETSSITRAQIDRMRRYVLKTWKYPVKDFQHINRTECMVNTLVDLLLLVRERNAVARMR